MPQNDNELLELTVYEQSKDSLEKLIDVEIDTFGQIMEELKDMPYVDKLIKFCKVGFGIMNMWQIRKIARFLKGSETISDEEKDKYLNSLNKKDKQRISGYLTNLLYVTEDEEKAEILGLIYAARVKNEINNEDMLRLSSDVNKVFVFDLQLLNNYVSPHKYCGYTTDNLYSAGLLEQLSSAEEIPEDNGVHGMAIGVRKYKLNIMGEKLMSILRNAGYKHCAEM